MLLTMVTFNFHSTVKKELTVSIMRYHWNTLELKANDLFGRKRNKYFIYS